MMQNNKRDIRLEEIKTVIAKPLQLVSSDSVADFLEDLQASSGLFLESEIGEWQFAHLTFQEYLAACHFLQDKVVLDWGVDDSWWHETLRLYAALGDATLLVQACLESNTVAALSLAVDCLEEALILDATVRQQIETRLINDLESEDVDKRKFAAEVYLNRQLKNLQRIDEHKEIDLNFITCAEYQLFLDEKRAEKEYYQPDHWTDYTFPKGMAREPIAGVRAKDAEDFCKWLSKDDKYRLPTPDEFNEYPTGDLGIWCKEGKTFSMRGLKKENKETIVRKLGIFERSNFQFNRDLDLNRALARALDRACDLDRARAIDRALDCALAIIRVHALDRAIARAIDCAIARAIDRAIDRAFVRDRARAFAFVFAFTLSLDRDRALASNLTNIYQAIENNHFQEAKQLAQAMKSETHFEQRLGTLLYELLTCATATTSLEARQAWRQYLVSLTEYTLIGYDELEKEKDYRPWWKRWLSRCRKIDFSEDKQNLQNLQGWLKIIIAREQGKLPAWEGIRIVRETLNK
jgi:hypothetical protein